MVTFATYHADITIETIDKVLQKVPLFKIYKVRELIQTFFRSARKFHPNCRCVVLTDLKTSFHFPSDIEIIPMDVDSSKLTLSRTQAQVQFLKNYQDNGALFFLDNDMLIQADLRPLFKDPFDIGLTFRDHEMPINGGVIMISPDRAQKALKFLMKMEKILLERYPEYHTWYGSQYALLDAVGKELFYHRQSDLVESDAVFIKFFPCDTYNFHTPDFKMDGYYPDKKILHFKGTRKKFMLNYWENYIKG